MNSSKKLIAILVMLIIVAGIGWLFVRDTSEVSHPVSDISTQQKTKGATMSEQTKREEPLPQATGNIDASADALIQDATGENSAFSEELRDSSEVSSENQTLIEFGQTYDQTSL